MERSAQVALRAGAALPRSPQELAEALGSAASRKRTIALSGAASKRLMAGPIEPADVTLSTAAMARVLQYEPRDLTISVEAGMRYADLDRLLAQNRQMIPLDPPFSDTATIGGILASNTSGPRRRLYGTARDLVIGMKFATLEGKLVQSGGMVVKNVAGLDMGKLMIGSFGTLAAIAVVNCKVLPRPAAEVSFLLPFETLDDAIAARDRILKGHIPPAAIDLLNPLAAAQLGRKGHVLALRVGGECGRHRALPPGIRRGRCAGPRRRGGNALLAAGAGVHAAFPREVRERRGGARFMPAGPTERCDAVVRDGGHRARRLRVSATRTSPAPTPPPAGWPRRRSAAGGP